MRQSIENQSEKKEFSFVERLKEAPITLIEKETKMTIENVQEFAPGKEIIVCDAYVKNIEQGDRESSGFKQDNILVIDHHLPIPEMSSAQICSTTLAIEYVLNQGINNSAEIIINHTDCDSILSSSIIRGIIEPLEKFGNSAIVADHTGQPDQIGDLLQGIEKLRNIEFSLRNLQLLLDGKEIEPEAKKLLEKRLRDRERAKEMIETIFKLTPSGKIAYAQLDEKIDSGLFPALMPEATIFLTYNPMFNKEGEKIPEMDAKVRLGINAPEGTDLRNIMKFDEIWGGRWNAGSSGRRGGTSMGIEEYAYKLEESYQKIIYKP